MKRLDLRFEFTFEEEKLMYQKSQRQREKGEECFAATRNKN